MFDENQPRDNQGQWTAGDAGEAIRAAASDEKGFTNAKTIGEAEKWAEENLKTKIISYKGVDINVANQINNSLHSIENSYKDFPQTSIGFSVEGRAYAQYDWNNNVVNFRKRYDNVEARRMDDNVRWKKQYGDDYHVSTTLDGIIKHEIAHSFDNNTGRKLYKELEVLPLEIKNKLYGISGYASVDRFFSDKAKGSEMIAEVISAKQTDSNKYKNLPKEATNIIDKYFKP